MATNNRRRDLMDRLDKAYGGKMYLNTSALADAIGWGRNRLARNLKVAGVPKIVSGSRIEYAKDDIRDWLYQMESAS